MLPSFDSERRRPINLGGSTPTASHASILDQARLRRIEREEHRRRADAAVVLQAWWRGVNEKAAARERLCRILEDGMDVDAGDGDGITQLRCLVLIGRDEALLGRWSSGVIANGSLLRPALGPDREHWLVLIRQMAVLLLHSVADRPQSEYAVPHLKVLTTLLDPSSFPDVGPSVPASITAYLLRRNFYEHVSTALRAIAPEAKNDPALPYLAQLTYLPLSTLSPFPPSSPASTTTPAPAPTGDLALFTHAFHALTTHILTIPLLPYRLPLPALSALAARLPLDALHVLAPWVPPPSSPPSPSSVPSPFPTTTPISSLPPPAHTPPTPLTHALAASALPHLLANLLAFAPPRYPALPAPALTTYLHLVAAILGALPPGALDADAGAPTATAWAADSDSDADADAGAPAAARQKPRLVLDARTRKRLQTLSAPTHLTALLRAVSSRSSSTSIRTHSSSSNSSSSIHALLPALLALLAAAPARKDKVLSALLAYGGGGLVREVWRDWVRGAGLGREGGSVMDPAHAPAWAPLLLLTELYTQSLLTMSDDEFFGGGRPGTGGGGAAGGAGGAGRPGTSLTLDELVEFSRMLFNIAFALYWKDSSALTGTGDTRTGTGTGDAKMDTGDTRTETGRALTERAGAGAGAGTGAWMEGTVPGAPGVRWEAARAAITRCLQAVVARDARKPFVPPGHWHVSDHIDMNLFVDAAVFEDQELSSEPTPAPLTPFPRTHRTHAPALSKRQLALFSPRLGVLNNIPFAIPFETRVAIFRRFVESDVARRYSTNAFQRNPWGRHSRGERIEVSIRRGNIAQDGYDKLAEADLKAPIAISFIDQFGEPEAGIDGGGVFKEFFTSLCKEVFDSDRGLWLANKRNELYPNPHSYATEPHSLNWYRFIGRILGKALYEGILVDVAFAGFFLAKWLGRQSFLDDLASLDPDLYQGLIFLKNYTGNMEDLSLNFTVATEEFGVAKALNLIPNGNNVAVTRENRLQYIYLVSHYRLSKQIKLQSEAFFEGLSEMIDPKWLRMFNQQELQILLGGVNAPIDLDDLREHTNYGGLYDNDEPTIQAFWKVIATFDQEQRRAFLRFVTSCSRPPLLGFKQLIPNFAIRDAGSDEHRLPTSSTCVNLLKLPRYKSAQVLRNKLLQAISSGAGFDLS
ncbi:HECT-domain-containing protein [Leucogyrophana mollusca]|uniref:HECT-domain-containing protein n=1 Tax=Leucogyrophana mollusca TaxID=85980 RepID=A0ACB8BA18_9AGAM|nr:HECT-domain-containing protein [Leucogyrophana mollusca]